MILFSYAYFDTSVPDSDEVGDEKALLGIVSNYGNINICIKASEADKELTIKEGALFISDFEVPCLRKINLPLGISGLAADSL